MLLIRCRLCRHRSGTHRTSTSITVGPGKLGQLVPVYVGGSPVVQARIQSGLRFRWSVTFNKGKNIPLQVKVLVVIYNLLKLFPKMQNI
jgi:hypothetical protein